MANQAIHVNGPALVYVQQAGRGSIKQLGIPEDGVDIEINHHDQPVMTDGAGPVLPADLQDMGQDAIIRMALSAYDIDLLNEVRRRGNAAKEGQSGSRGRLLGANGHTFKLLIASETDQPWRFFTAVLRGPLHTKPATRYSVQRLTWYAWALVGAANNSAGAGLYDHTFG